MNLHGVRRRVSIGCALCALLGTLTPTAYAQPGEGEAATQDVATSCAAAYEQAQTDKLDGKYRSAREHAQRCSQLECNAAIVRECVQLYEKVQSEIPTFVFSARKADGTELTHVRVTMDGEILLPNLDGTPVALDPGAHRFSFETDGFPVQDATHTARVGDKNRLIEVVFGEKEKPAEVAPPSTEVTLTPPQDSGGVPTATYVLGGVGLVAMGAFAYLRVTGANDYNELNGRCSPNCTESEVDDVRTTFTLSYVALGVGAASLTSALVVYLVSGGGSGSAETAQRTTIGLAPTPGGAAAHFSARF